jgi:hypothetical protein
MKPEYTLHKMNKEGVFTVLPPHTMGNVKSFDCVEYNGTLWFMDLFMNDNTFSTDIKVYVP